MKRVVCLLASLVLPAGLRAQTAADSAWARKDIDTAYRLYEARLARDSSDAVALQRVAIVKAWNQNYDQSLALLQRAMRADPANSAIVVDHARILGWARRFDDALRELNGVLAESPDDTNALELKANVLSWAKRPDESLRFWQRLESMDPANTTFTLAVARALVDAGKRDQAFTKLQSGLARDSANADMRALAKTLAPLMVDAAQKLSWAQRFDSATTVFNQLLSIDPSNVDALLASAANYRYQGKNSAAKRLLTRVAAIDPANKRLAEERGYMRGGSTGSIAPNFNYVSDSDGNRISAFGAQATVPLSSAFDLRIGGNHKDFTQVGDPSLDHEVVSGHIGLNARTESGWHINGAVGVWQPSEDRSRRLTTSSIAVATPYKPALQATLSYQRSLFDATALLVSNAIELHDLRLDATTVTSKKGVLEFGASTARFIGSESNTRTLGSARFNYRVQPWLTAGPAARYFHFAKTLHEGYWNPDNYSLLEFGVTAARLRGAWYPSLEVAPGYQHIVQTGTEDKWNVSMRLQGGLAYVLGNGRQIGVNGVFANSGLTQLSPIGDASYKYRAFTVFGTWGF